MADDGESLLSIDDWADRLAASLKERERDFHMLQEGSRSVDADQEQCRSLALKTAAFALLDVLGALKELPQFQAEVGLAPLQSLVAGLHDLTIGGRPRLLERAAGIGTGRDGIGRFLVKKHAATGVLLLVATGLKESAARQRVAAELRSLGFKGRKGGALSPKTLFDWVEDCRATPAWTQMTEFVQQWAADPQTPLTEERALSWLRAVGASAFMQSQI